MIFPNMASFSPQGSSVAFLGCSKNPLEIAFFIKRIRQTEDNPFALWHSIRLGEITKSTMLKSVKQNYIRPLQNTLFLFLVENISNNCYQNLPRGFNNVGDIGLFQDRLLKSKGNKFVTPPEFLADKAVSEKWKKLQQEISDFAQYCTSKGISVNDTGLLQPLAAIPRDVLAFDFKIIQRFLENKMCEKTSWETKKLAWQIYEVMKSEFPILAQRLGIKCWETRQMYCNEPDNDYMKCRFGNGIRPHKTNLETIWYSNCPIQENKSIQPA